MKKQYEVIIVGGSYSGLAAGMALGRALRSVLIIDSGNPCNRQTPYSHNFLTQDGKPPSEIAAKGREQVQQYSTVNFLDAFVTSGTKFAEGFEVKVSTGETFAAKQLIFATGIKDIMPDLPGFKECWGISALHCPYCHGYEVRQQATGILANGEAAYEISMLISNWTDDLAVFTNGASTLGHEQRSKLEKHGIDIIEKEIERLNHDDGYLRNIVFKDGTKTDISALYARMSFTQHSMVPQSLGCELTEEGYIKIDAANKTSVDGIYACGDNAGKMRTVANAVAMGTTAGMVANREFIEANF